MRTVRFSTRPCPFSTPIQTRSGPGDGTSGGKSRRDTPRGALKSEADSDVPFQPQLVALDREQVVAPLLDNLGTHVPLTEQGVAQNDAALDRQDAQQLQGGLVFVGLGVHAYLGENGFLFMSVGRHEVVAR